MDTVAGQGAGRIAAVILVSFLGALALVAVATVFAALRGLGLWRQAKRTARAFGSELARFEERSARTERLLAEAEQAGEELQAALARLRASRARLRVLANALGDARRRTRWLAVFFPR
ncbi:MAG TPA: hypothetical protein VNJ46_07115 [Gaiellaceae bacterium]|nr:hypothetical protein [Gaiellaceae bacterium]